MPIKKKKRSQIKNSQEENWGETDASKQKKTLPKGWNILLTFLIAGSLLLLFGLFMWQTFFGNRQANEARDQIARESYIEPGSEKDAYGNIKKAVTAYFSSESVDELIALCRQPSRVGPLIEKYYEDNPLPVKLNDGPLKIISINPVSAGFPGDDQTGLVLVRIKKGSSQHTFILKEKDNAQYLIDWESHICHQPMDWDKFVESRHTEALPFRVLAALDQHYPYEYSDDDEYQSYSLSAPRGKRNILAFAKRDSESDLKLKKLLENNTQTRQEPFIIKLRFKKTDHDHGGLSLASIEEVSLPIC